MKKQRFTIYFDEAWRGPLAWPVFIWLICPIKKLSKKELYCFCDSKKISESTRETHFNLIKNLQKEKKIFYSVARMTAKEIDSYWMTNAIHCAILRWMYKLFADIYSNWFSLNIHFPNPLSTEIDSSRLINYHDIQSLFSNLHSNWVNISLVLDWNRDFWLWKNFPFWDIKTIIHWDDTIKEISMASIIAKVSRDYVMKNLPNKYLKYNFSKHKWYWTEEHKKLITEYGPSDIHRKLFLKWVYPKHIFKKALPSKF